jgi:hypothetical protein
MVLNITKALKKQARMRGRRQAAARRRDTEVRAILRRIQKQAMAKLDQKNASAHLHEAHLELNTVCEVIDLTQEQKVKHFLVRSRDDRIQIMMLLEEKAGRETCKCETCIEGTQLLRAAS